MGAAPGNQIFQFGESHVALDLLLNKIITELITLFRSG
jgi:hypothetical protein